MQRSEYCTLHTVHRALYTVHCTLYTVLCTPSDVGAVCTTHCTLPCTVHRTLYTVPCTLYSVHRVTLVRYAPRTALHVHLIVHCALYGALYTVRCTLCALRGTPADPPDLRAIPPRPPRGPQPPAALPRRALAIGWFARARRRRIRPPATRAFEVSGVPARPRGGGRGGAGRAGRSGTRSRRG